MISFRRWGGERSMMLWTVRRRTDQASLWKHTITLVSGKLSWYTILLHLKKIKNKKKIVFLPKTEILALIRLLIIDLFVSKMELTKIKLHWMKSEKKKKNLMQMTCYFKHSETQLLKIDWLSLKDDKETRTSEMLRII